MGKNGNSKFHGGFTLIEMLIVIVIIVILMGVVFRLSRAGMAKGNDARETARVAIFKALLEEFHAEYGIYPPVPVYDGVQPLAFTGPYPKKGDSQDLRHYVNEHKDAVFKFGLMSFFVDRKDYGQRTAEIAGTTGNKEAYEAWATCNTPWDDKGTITVSSKDSAFINRILPIRQNIGYPLDHHDIYDDDKPKWEGIPPEFDSNGDTVGFEVTSKDLWENEYVYICRPPYTSYQFFSKGADGKYDKDAPGDKTKPENKDNIYATLEDE